MLAADRKLSVHEFESGWRRCFAGTVVVRIRHETVVEKSVPVIPCVTLREETNRGETEHP